MVFEVDQLRPMYRDPISGRVLWFYLTTDDNLRTADNVGYIDALNHDIAVNDLVILVANDNPLIGRVSAIGGTTPFPVTLNFLGGRAVFIDDSEITDAGGSTPDANVESFINYLAQRVNLKIQQFNNASGLGFTIGLGIDRSDPVSRSASVKRIIAGTNISITSQANSITINATGP